MYLYCESQPVLGPCGGGGGGGEGIGSLALLCMGARQGGHTLVVELWLTLSYAVV